MTNANTYCLELTTAAAIELKNTNRDETRMCSKIIYILHTRLYIQITLPFLKFSSQ